MRPFIEFKKAIQKLTLVFVLLISLFASIQAQDSSFFIEVTMKDGSFLVGELIEDSEEYLILLTTSIGRVKISKLDIKSYQNIKSAVLKNGEYYHRNPNVTRNIFTPTGYNLRKNEGYYQNFMLGINQVSYGFTDNFTLGVTFEIFSLLGTVDGKEAPGFAITPKYSITGKEDTWSLGVGAMIVNIPYTDRLFDWSLLYAVNTFGTKDKNISFGIGYGFRDGVLADNPTLTIAGNYRLSPKVSLTSENWILPGNRSEFDNATMINMLGIRYLGKNVSWDFAVGGFTSATGLWGGGPTYIVSPLPVVGLTVPFGKGWTK